MIGDRVTLYQGVTLGGTGFQRGKRHPTLGDNVTVGSGAKLLGPIAVGDGAKVGANTVVVEDVPPGATVVGNPGHPVRVEGKRVEGPDADWIHLPDPIAEAIKALSERIADLERRLSDLDGGNGPARRVARHPPPHRPLLGRRLSAARSLHCRGADKAPHAPAAAPLYSRRRCCRASSRCPPKPRSRPPGRPTEAGADRVERLLAGLNPPQREAVEHGEGPLLVRGRRRLGQDPGPDPPDRLPARHRRRPAGGDPRDHLHQQGGGGDARAGRRSWSAARCGRCG